MKGKTYMFVAAVGSDNITIANNERTNSKKIAFGQTIEKKEPNNNSGMLISGLTAAAAIGIAVIMIKNGKATTAKDGESFVQNAVQSIKEFELVAENIAKKYKIKNYVTNDKLDEINGIFHKDGVPYTGNVIRKADIPVQERYKNGKLFLKRIIDVDDISVEKETNEIYSTCKYSLNEKGQHKIFEKWIHKKLVDIAPPEQDLKAASVGAFPQHTYSVIPDIGVLARGYGERKNYTFYKMTNNAIDPRNLYSKIDYKEFKDVGNVLLVAGKMSDGKKVVFLQVPAGRRSKHWHPIRNTVTLTSRDENFNEVQLDLIKAVSGKSQEALTKEMPLARAVSERYYSKINETINIDENVLLNEIAHFSKGRELNGLSNNLLKYLDTLPNDSYVRLVG